MFGRRNKPLACIVDIIKWFDVNNKSTIVHDTMIHHQMQFTIRHWSLPANNDCAHADLFKCDHLSEMFNSLCT